MKLLKNLSILLFFLIAFQSNAQLRSYNSISDQTQNSSVFFDASASPLSLSANTDLGKGMIYPRADLTQFNFTPLSSTFFETGYDGMIVYNTVSGTTPATGSGIGGQTVEPGFYYFSNPGSTGNSATGEWIPFVGGSDTKTEITNNTINETTTIINGVPEKVVLVDGVADGTTTQLTLDGTILSSGDVTKLREAKIYQGNRLFMIASGDYDAAGNVLVTGDGMVNKLLPAGTYSVELYYE